ncbi:ABC transporter permease [Streptomyces sp. NPDC098789]|uniref:ABC transporter permease n=1 Tax=Streptomyces sp. NPDC098789 TaxID=3366098 RepID=UPI00381F63D3
MLSPARLSARDVLRVGGFGLRTRPMRAFLSALGIAIGIAAMVAVVGISTSSQANLQRELDRIGTNLLSARPGSSVAIKKPVKFTEGSAGQLARIEGVESATAVGKTAGYVYRNDRIPANETNNITPFAVQSNLLETVRGAVRTGSWLNDTTAEHQVTVLGSSTAQALGIIAPGGQVLIGGRWFTVAGILDPLPLTPELDYGALIGWDAAKAYLSFNGNPNTLHARTSESEIQQVQKLIAPSLNPEDPTAVKVSNPAQALMAKRAGEAAFTGLLLGLGAVALLVGGIGVANTMVISVLERRGEVGLRRSMGATRGQIRSQFLTESLLLSALGGVAGVLLGSGATAVFALLQGFPVVVPPWVIAGGLCATIAIGGVAGLYPAVRASCLSPTAALTAV